MKLAYVLAALAACAALTTTGCATNTMTRSGFLDDYERLAPTRFERVLLYRSPGFEWGRYAEIMVDAPLVATGTGRIDGLDETQQREVLEYLGAELRQRAKALPLPDASSRLRLRAAITELQTPNRAVNAVATLVVGPVTTGGASLELEAIDELDGRRVAAATCFERGHVMSDFWRSYTLLGHAKTAISACIERIDQAWREAQRETDRAALE